MANKLIHKRSSVITDNNPKLPQADSLEFGEMAINYADGYETISFKNTENEIIEFRSKKYFENIISENEEVVSQALNDLNKRVDTTQEAYAAADDALKVYVDELIDGLDIPTNLSELTNDVPFVTQGEFNSLYNTVNNKQDNISDLEDIRQGASKGATALQSYTEQYQGTVQSVETSETLDEVNTTTNVKYVAQTLTDAQKAQARANIGAAAVGEGGGGTTLTESDIAAMGFTKNTGTYSKPSGGIPKTDLDSSVQTSLGKADTALQSYTEQYKGTITGVSANGTSVATSGVANIPAASTSQYGVTKLSSATNSTSTSLAATASAVKAAYDLANSYKGTVTSVKVDNVSKTPSSGAVDLGYVNKKLTTSASSSMTLSPNIYYRNTSTSLSTLTITLGSVSNSNIINEYFVEFTTRSAGTTVSLPSTIKWANGEAPTFEASTTYQISIVNNLGVVTKFR